MLVSDWTCRTARDWRSVLLCGAWLGVAACAPEYAGIVLNVKSIPANTVKLILKPVVSGKTLPFETFDQNITGVSDTQIGLRMAREDLGRNLAFTIDAYSGGNCSIATVSASVQVDEIKRYDLDVVMKAGNDALATDL